MLDEAAFDEIVLVSTDGDFRQKRADGLATALLEDLETLGYGRDRVRLATSIYAAAEAHVEPSADARTRVRADLRDERFAAILYEAVNEAMLYTMIEVPDDEELRRLSVDEVDVDGRTRDRNIEIADAYEVDGTLAFRFQATLDIDAEFFAFKYEAAGAEFAGVHISDWDWNESMVRARNSSR